MVTSYNYNNCKYAYDRLDNVVFLVSKNAIGNISIDNGAAYVASASSAMSIACSNISLSEDETLDERYEFNHKLQFTVQGYMNVDDFEGKYYVIVKDVNNTYWLMNPMFPCKVTYTYTIGANENHTDFTFSTISNFPLLKVNDFTTNYTKPCNGYNLCGIDILAINEKDYSTIEGDTVTYSNDGFKDVVFLRNSCVFTEQFDGTNVSHQVKFKISFDDYKSSWHYNLLEFTDNKYAMVLQTKCGTNIACGFNKGLQPSFIVNSSDDSVNSIEISLSDLHNEGTFIKLPSNVPYSYTSATTWVWVEGEYECINDTTAKRLLMQECDAFWNRLDRYKCLEGYRVDYEYLADKLVGEFTEIVTFPCDACRNTSCGISTSMPFEMTFTTSGQSKSFSLSSSSDFTVESSTPDITVIPTSGVANTPYILTITSNATPTSAAVEHTVTISSCEGSYVYESNVIVQEQSASHCLPQGQYYHIYFDSQEVIIPTSCCVMEVSANTINLKEFQIQDGYVRMRVDANDTGSGRTMTVKLSMCDGTESYAYVIQDSFLSRWVTEKTVCNGRLLCDFDRLYSGVTQDAITAKTYVTRWNNCVESEECRAKNYKWTESTDTVCDGGKMWYLEYLFIYENDSWRRTGQVRYGRQAEDVSGKCSTHIEHWITVDNDYYCYETTKYNKERLYYEENYGDPQSAWTETDIYRMGDTVIEYDSTDCGYGSDSGYTYQQWRPYGYECMSGSKYTKERKFVSNNTTDWVATDIYRTGVLVEQFSEECGWVADYDYRWVLVDEYQCGSGDSQYNLYQMYGQERRPKGSFSELEWELVVPTVLSYDANGTEDPVMIESGSSQCGSHSPSYDPQYRWVELPNTNIDYYCSGTTKYFMEKKQISVDGGNTWSDMSPIEYRRGDVVEYDSVECGGGSGNEPTYRWTTITPTSSDTTYICDECQAFDGKWIATYSDSSVSSAECDSTSAITNGEIDGTNLLDIQIGDCVTTIGQAAFDWCRSLTSVTIPDSVTIIGDESFWYCTSLENLRIGSGVTTIAEEAFAVCYSLTSVTIPDSVTSIGEAAFDSCSGLTSLVIPNSVTSIGSQAFGACTSLTSLTISSNITNIGNFTFYNCSGLTSIVIPDNVTSIGVAAFIGCTSLTSIDIPDSVTTIKDGAFEYCSGLTSCTIGSGVTSIGDGAFTNCTSLASIDIPDSVTTIKGGAFEYCSGLTSCTIASGVTSIGNYAFNGCVSLTNIDIPSGVTSIGSYAFGDCSSLLSITVNAPTPPTLGHRAFDNTNRCPIYVPAQSVSAYQSASGWRDYVSRIQAIP